MTNKSILRPINKRHYTMAKKSTPYSWAYIFLEKGAGDNTGKTENQQEDRDSDDQTGNREEDWWGYHQETLWEVDGGEGYCDAD